jgi:hypothetical protein
MGSPDDTSAQGPSGTPLSNDDVAKAVAAVREAARAAVQPQRQGLGDAAEAANVAKAAAAGDVARAVAVVEEMAKAAAVQDVGKAIAAVEDVAKAAAVGEAGEIADVAKAVASVADIAKASAAQSVAKATAAIADVAKAAAALDVAKAPPAPGSADAGQAGLLPALDAALTRLGQAVEGTDDPSAIEQALRELGVIEETYGTIARRAQSIAEAARQRRHPPTS